MSEYAVVTEDAGPNLCAYVPDLPTSRPNLCAYVPDLPTSRPPGLRLCGLHR